eukprot:gene4338-3152_t
MVNFLPIFTLKKERKIYYFCVQQHVLCAVACTSGGCVSLMLYKIDGLPSQQAVKEASPLWAVPPTLRSDEKVQGSGATSVKEEKINQLKLDGIQ